MKLERSTHHTERLGNCSRRTRGKYVPHVHSASRALPAMASTAPDTAAWNKDGVVSVATAIPKAINLRK
ncbi:MAG: hypothetical protein HZB26_15650 [Candidatus Hydrogenedentes bacterium]|nr:hypothetical protein [Candidatus Hydrogenedentota bacterium]